MIEAGHSHHELLEFTFAQFRGYLRAAARREAERERKHTLAMTYAARAAQYDKANFNAFVRKLGDGK